MDIMSMREICMSCGKKQWKTINNRTQQIKVELSKKQQAWLKKQWIRPTDIFQVGLAVMNCPHIEPQCRAFKRQY